MNSQLHELELSHMDQHPVPQNISSYEFRLVGDMTLKQFLQLAAGALIGLIIFKLPIISIVRYPLVFLSALTGVMMAFVPIQGRSFTQWIMAFIKAIYAPTEYHWLPPSSLPATASGTAETPPPLTAQPAGGTSPFPSPSPIGPGPIPASTPISISPIKSQLQPTAPLSAADVARYSPAPSPASLPQAKQTGFTKASAPPPRPIPIPPASPVTSTAPATRLPIANNYKAPPASYTIPPTTPFTPPPSITPLASHSPITNLPPSAQMSSTLPSPPAPNILIGQVVSSTNDPQEGTIVEIIDSSSGIPVRALRTNRAGLFQIATPLSSGNYVIRAEKDPLAFDPISIEAAGSIIQPIIIKAKA